MAFLPSLCFISSHPNANAHFSAFREGLSLKGVRCEIVQNDLAGEDLSQFDYIITDISDERWLDLHQELAEKHPSLQRGVYYDNPERFVPGKYSLMAEKMIEECDLVLFANAEHPIVGVRSEAGEIDLSNKKTIGIGYYPQKQAQEIREKRGERAPKEGKVFVYVGGANEVYYEKAFPHFIDLLSTVISERGDLLENVTILLQQHPRARREGNIDAGLVSQFLKDRELPRGFRFEISDQATLGAIAGSDGVFYYQTSMNAQFAFGGVPLIVQVAHETYEDLLIRSGYLSVTTEKALIDVFSNGSASGNPSSLEKELGMRDNWADNLYEGLVKE